MNLIHTLIDIIGGIMLTLVAIVMLVFIFGFFLVVLDELKRRIMSSPRIK